MRRKSRLRPVFYQFVTDFLIILSEATPKQPVGLRPQNYRKIESENYKKVSDVAEKSGKSEQISQMDMDDLNRFERFLAAGHPQSFTGSVAGPTHFCLIF